MRQVVGSPHTVMIMHTLDAHKLVKDWEASGLDEDGGAITGAVRLARDFDASRLRDPKLISADLGWADRMGDRGRCAPPTLAVGHMISTAGTHRMASAHIPKAARPTRRRVLHMTGNR